jgi:class 3 adenylate cyclase
MQNKYPYGIDCAHLTQLLLVREVTSRAITGNAWDCEIGEVVATALAEFAELRDSAPASNPPQLRTLLVSDLEQFTPTVHRLGDARARELIRTHDRIMRACLAANHGAEVAHTGDGLIASFANASHAIHCASAMQHAMAAHNAEQPLAAMQVRIGLHAGRPIAAENRLFGTCVNTAVRVCAVASGFQVIASSAVLALVSTRWFAFSDRGAIMLKGLPEPVHVYQLDWRTRLGTRLN